MQVGLGMRVCSECGRQYFNWCIYCQSQKEIESIPQIMEKFGLSTDNLVLELAHQISQNSFPALNLAFNLKGINITKRVEFEGKIGIESKIERLSNEEIDARIIELTKKEDMYQLEDKCQQNKNDKNC
jgi:hypothetical protein